RNREDLQRIAEEERSVIASFAESLRADGIAIKAVSVGSTPTMSVAARMTGVDEIRPGNYAFYDGTQVALGACALEDCALTVLATVISSSASGSDHSVIDAGALALSKDLGPLHLGHQS